MPPAARRTTEISPGRYAIELPTDTPPERVLADLIAAGAKLVSLNPVRDTLEDFFLKQVAEAGSARPRVARGFACGRLAASRSACSASRSGTGCPTTSCSLPSSSSASSFFLGQLTAGQDVKIIKDLGLAAIAIFGLFIAIFIGIGLVSKEVERRSIYALLAKPISRPQLILGKYAGLVLTLAVNVAVMTVALYAVLAYMTWTTPAGAPDGLGRARRRSGALEGALPDLRRADARHRGGALLLDLLDADPFRRAHVRPLYRRALQRRSEELRAGRRVEERGAGSRAALYHVLPDLSAFDVKTQVVHGLAVPRGYLALTAGYGVALHRAAPVIATLIFSRRDFK